MTFLGDQDRSADFGGLADSAEPAWLWQPGTGALLWGNAAALKLWGVASLAELQGLKIDRAMPAFGQLQRLQWALAADASVDEPMVMWLARGSRVLICHCRKVPFGRNDSALLLQVVEPGADASIAPASLAPPPRRLNGHANAVGAQALAPRPQPALAPEDAVTLSEIARLIRERTIPGLATSPRIDDAEAEPARHAPPATLSDAEFLARLSHELRTPLNAIIGFAELLQAERDGPLGSARYRAYAGHILESAAHCLNLSNDLVNRTSLDPDLAPQEFSEVDVNQVMQACLGILTPIAGKAGVTLIEHRGTGLPRAILDQRSLRQILLNLLTNAIKATAPGGNITVATEYQAGAGLVLSVTDQGRGMTPDELSRARGVAAMNGSGLGLPLSRKLAEANGGTLEIDSTLGQGARAALRLPMRRLVM